MANLTQNTTLASDTAGEVYVQYQNRPNIVALASLVGTFAQQAENNLWAILTTTGISPNAPGYSLASGAQLDLIGRIVGLPRTSTDDSQYLARLQAQVRIYKSSGTIPEIQKVLDIVVPSGDAQTNIVEYAPAAFVADLTAQPIMPTYASVYNFIVQEMCGAGIDAQTLFTEQTLSNTFTCDIGPGCDSGYLAGVLD